jgi:polysaccharide export outer membrane protein
MQGKFDTAKLSQIHMPDPLVRKGDLLSIIVYSDNPAATALYNQPLITNGASGGSSSQAESRGEGITGAPGASPTAPGYPVDENGNIQFQGLGILHVEGLTKSQIKALLDSKLKDSLLNNPYYSIRFLNYRFTIVGEVNHPGIFSIPGEQISLLEAIGLAGDMNFYGRRDNVLIIRQNIKGQREFQRLDLTKPDIMGSPFFYLQQGDFVYVEATNKKVVASDQITARNVSIGLAIVSTLALIYSIFRN